MAKDKPDPRPTIRTSIEGDRVKMEIYIPTWCLDNQSHALTHDQLKHITGQALSGHMLERRKELEQDG